MRHSAKQFVFFHFSKPSEAIYARQAERHHGLLPPSLVELRRMSRNDDAVKRVRHNNPSGKSLRSRKTLSSPFAKNFSLYLATRYTSERIHPAR
jgi:hypothetical protein